MKTFGYLLVVGLVYFAQAAKEEDIKQFHKAILDGLQTCGKELKIDVKPFMGDAIPDMAKLNEADYVCLSKCLLQKFGIVDANGKYKREELKALIPDLPAEVDKAITDCLAANDAETDLCVKYSKSHKCVLEKIKHQ